MDRDVLDVGMEEIGEMVSADIINDIGDLLNEAKVSVGTVHFSLAYMIADSIGDEDNPKDVAVGILSIQQYIYNVAIAIHRQRRVKKEAN